LEDFKHRLKHLYTLVHSSGSCSRADHWERVVAEPDLMKSLSFSFPLYFAEVQAVLLTDILVFLQEKDQKYVFASLVS
jgi:hypothetical protein